MGSFLGHVQPGVHPRTPQDSWDIAGLHPALLIRLSLSQGGGFSGPSGLGALGLSSSLSTPFISISREPFYRRRILCTTPSPGIPQEGWIPPFSHASPGSPGGFTQDSVECLASEGPEGLAAPLRQGQHWTTEYTMLPQSLQLLCCQDVSPASEKSWAATRVPFSCSGSLQIPALPQSLGNYRRQ